MTDALLMDARSGDSTVRLAAEGDETAFARLVEALSLRDIVQARDTT